MNPLIKLNKIILGLVLLILSSMSNALDLPIDSRIPGGIAVIDLHSPVEMEVSFNNRKILQIKDKDNNYWAVIGIPLKQKVGKVSYTVNGINKQFLIKDKAYKEQYLTVKRKHSNPPADQIKRIQKESRLSKKVFTSFSNINKDSNFNSFLLPSQGPISSPFGLKRFFNKQARRPHSGIDIAAPRGADILAPAAGKIVLTGNFFFNGNSIFIDHGQGLITMYCHMDTLEVVQGKMVSAGELIGKVGSTGRATGPHLHWTVSLNNTRVEPLLFLAPTAFK